MNANLSHLEGFYNQSTANRQNGGITALKSNTKSFEAFLKKL